MGSNAKIATVVDARPLERGATLILTMESYENGDVEV